MARSIDRAARASNIQTPAEWTEQLPHKWCGRLDAGRKGKPNKTQKCDDWYVGFACSLHGLDPFGSDILCSPLVFSSIFSFLFSRPSHLPRCSC